MVENHCSSWWIYDYTYFRPYDEQVCLPYFMQRGKKSFVNKYFLRCSSLLLFLKIEQILQLQKANPFLCD